MKLRYEKCMKSRAFTDPTRKIKDQYMILDKYVKRLETKINILQKDKKTQFIELISKLDTLSPLKTLTRGYCLTEKENKIIKSASELKKNDNIKLKFYDGEKTANIFEESMKKLEDIVIELENGNLNLDESVNKFEEGMKISKQCNKILEEAEKKITILLENDGELEEENFEVE